MKFWKNWPYWVKGGIVGSIICIIFFIIIHINYLKTLQEPNIDMLPISFMSFAISSEPTFSIIQILTKHLPKGQLEIFLLISGLINWFLYGVIIGWTYGKIRSKRQIIS